MYSGRGLIMIRRFGVALLLLFSAFFCVIAWGAEPVVTSPIVAAYSPVGQIMKMIVGLMVVLIMIFVVAWVARNYMGFNPSSNAELKSLAGVLVGQKERVVLVQVGVRQILIGVAPGQITLLHVLDKADEVTVESSQPLSPFAEKLKNCLGPKKKS